MKTGRERIDDTLNYLVEREMGQLADEIMVTAGAQLEAIGEELSLERWRLFRTDAGTLKRRALRALLLCQRVYMSELWAKYFGAGATLQPVRTLPDDWKDTSLEYWYDRDEPEVLEAIRAYTVTTDSADGLSEVAAAGHPGDLSLNAMDLTRDQRYGGGPCCYRAVMIWLFRSGLVSYRWFLRHAGVDNEASLTDAFGPGMTVWLANAAEFRLVDEHGRRQIGLDGIPPDRIVHLYSEAPGRWNGHWLISMGNGRASGCNNDQERRYGELFPPHAGALGPYSNVCNLNAQFLAYKEPQGALHERGVAVVIDPLALPQRM